jgi:radical SAM superfamily enzyme YgiQ (UPF0313 family)
MARHTVLLVNPNLMRPPVGPIGLDYVAGALGEAGFDPMLCDLAFAGDWQSCLDNALASAAPLAVGVTVRNLDDAYFASQDFILARTRDIVTRIGERTSAPVVLGGVGFSIAPREVLRFTRATYGIAGEGERAFPLLLDCIVSGDEPARVPGAVFRLADGSIAANPPAPCDLAGLAASPRDFADNRRYFAEGGQGGVETKRGCDRRCIYCADPVAKGGSLRLRPPERVVEEFRALYEQGVVVLHLCDSEFNIPRGHARAVCDALTESGLGSKVRWYAYASPAPFDADLARAMARAGCVGLNFGADHADAEMLEMLGRRHSADDIARAGLVCRDAGLAVMFDMLLGAPGETRETVRRTVDFMRNVPAESVGLSCGVRVYPGTPLAGYVRRQGPLHENLNLHGAVEDNDDLLRPVFFVDASLGAGIHEVVADLVDGDPRFLAANPSDVGANYNYNENSFLADAIRDGERGAYWHILQRLNQEG